MKTWREAVIDGIRRLTEKKQSHIFSRQEIIIHELDHIVLDVQAEGETPSQTLSRVLQELRDDQLIKFVDNQGNYIFLENPIQIEDEDLPETAIDAALRQKKMAFGELSTGESVARRRQRLGQQRLRHWTLQNYQHQCALCDITDAQLLVTAHVARWADCPGGRGDLSNTVCLCRWHDPLLEYGIISLSDDYQILKKKPANQLLQLILQETTVYRKPVTLPLSQPYLAMHRQRTGFNSSK